jgi:hypothetical protein
MGKNVPFPALRRAFIPAGVNLPVRVYLPALYNGGFPKNGVHPVNQGGNIAKVKGPGLKRTKRLSFRVFRRLSSPFL